MAPVRDRGRQGTAAALSWELERIGGKRRLGASRQSARCRRVAAGTNGNRTVTCGGTPLDGFAPTSAPASRSTAGAASGTSTRSAVRSAPSATTRRRACGDVLPARDRRRTSGRSRAGAAAPLAPAHALRRQPERRVLLGELLVQPAVRVAPCFGGRDSPLQQRNCLVRRGRAPQRLSDLYSAISIAAAFSGSRSRATSACSNASRAAL